MIRFKPFAILMILLIALPALLIAQEAEEPVEEPQQQEETEPQDAEEAAVEPAAENQEAQLDPPYFTASTLANRSIEDTMGNQLGSVTDLFINSSGQITHLIVSLQNIPQFPAGEYVAPVHLFQLQEDRLVVSDPVQPLDQLIAPLSGVKTSGFVAIDSVRANDLVDYNLVNEFGQSIGSVEDVVFNLEDRQVVYMALNFGEMLGVAEKMFAVPFSDIWYHLGQEIVTIYNLNQQAIEQNPGFESDDWPQQANPDWNRMGDQAQAQPQDEPQQDDDTADEQDQQQ